MTITAKLWLWTGLVAVAILALLALVSWPEWLTALLVSRKAFFSAVLNGVTVAGLYFIVAAGFTLIFGLLRVVNMAHGTLYLLGAYVGYEAVTFTGSWLLGAIAAASTVAVLGVVLQVAVFRHIEKDELRQTLVSIGLTILFADLMMATWGGQTYQITVPDLLSQSVRLPIMSAVKSDGTVVYLNYPAFRLFVLATALAVGAGLWLMLTKSRIGLMVRAGVDDRGMLAASGVNVDRVFILIFALGAGLAGFAGLVGGTALSVSPGEDIRYLLASLVVVIVGGMGSIGGAAIGAVLIGLPSYSAVCTFLIMVATLIVRPEGILGKAGAR